MVVAIGAIVAVAAVAIAGFAYLGSPGLQGKVLVAFAKHYEGTWADQQGDKAIIDTAGGIARISIISGTDGSPVLSATANGDNISVDNNNGRGEGPVAQMPLSKNVFVYNNPSSGETYTFVRR